jgi:hypothetical protein
MKKRNWEKKEKLRTNEKGETKNEYWEQKWRSKIMNENWEQNLDKWWMKMRNWEKKEKLRTNEGQKLTMKTESKTKTEEQN